MRVIFRFTSALLNWTRLRTCIARAASEFLRRLRLRIETHRLLEFREGIGGAALRPQYQAKLPARLRGRRLIALRLLPEVQPQVALRSDGIASASHQTLCRPVVGHGIVRRLATGDCQRRIQLAPFSAIRSEEHTSELQ